MFPWADTVARRYPPVAVWSVVGISLLAFLYQSGLPPRALNRFLFDFALVPSRVFGQLRLVAPSEWTPFLTNIFLHGGWLHLCCSPQKPGHFSRCCLGRDELAG